MKIRRFLYHPALALAATALVASAQEPRGFRTGPEIGERIPAFQAVDSNGTNQTLESLMGAEGLVLMFVRSADW